MPYRKLWIALSLVLLISFAVLGGVGYKVLSNAPPIPAQVATSDGRVLFDGDDIRDGQNAWQSIGGQEVGTVWGHGAYVAPDWTADWLHRECMFILDRWAKDRERRITRRLDVEQQAALQARLARDDAAQHLRRCDAHASRSIRCVPTPSSTWTTYYADVFSHGRDEYAIPPGALSDPAKLRQMSAFFWWTAWAASTNRPGTDVTYTQNWPHEELIGNRPTGGPSCGASSVLCCCWRASAAWCGISARSRAPVAERASARSAIRLLGLKPTPSQRATVKYFFVVAALWVVQVGLGAITAHYGVEGNGFYGIPLDRGCRTAWRAPGICRSASSGLRRRGWRPASTSPRRSAAANRRASGWASTLLFRRADPGGGGIAGGRVDEHPAEARQSLVLVRHAGLRVRGPGPLLADSAVRRPGVLAVADVARAEAGACRSATRTIRCC